MRKNKGAVDTFLLIMTLIAIIAGVIVLVTFLALKGKMIGWIEFIKNLSRFRFGS